MYASFHRRRGWAAQAHGPPGGPSTERRQGTEMIRMIGGSSAFNAAAWVQVRFARP